MNFNMQYAQLRQKELLYQARLRHQQLPHLEALRCCQPRLIARIGSVLAQITTLRRLQAAVPNVCCAAA